MKGKESIQYTLEREFLAKFSVEELLIHIVKAHRNLFGAVAGINAETQKTIFLYEWI